MSAASEPASVSNWFRRRDALTARLRAAHETRMPLVMGIVNVTPDSFSDGGQFHEVRHAVRHACALAAEGADILDLGGESTRPGAVFVDADQEIHRTAPVIDALSRQAPDVPISIDTYKASVAREAVGCGAVMINDVWGLRHDPDMAAVAAETGALVVVMHNRRDVDPDLDILDDLRRVFDDILDRARRAGIPERHIVLDPGVGFGKTDAQNLACIAHLDMLGAYDLPVLLGLSRKSFIGRALNRNVEARLAGTLACNLEGARKGAAIACVHDVAPHVDALRMAGLVRAA